MADGLTIKHDDDLERAFDVWVLVRKSLEVQSFGINVIELPTGGTIPEHDETARDQEEVFFVIAGAPTLVVNGVDYPLNAGSFARLDPELQRTVRNDADEKARLLIVSAPRTSGYVAMDWA